MDTSEQIKAWLEGIDERIDAFSVDPAEAKRDSFLRRLFVLAFPPDGLPDKITFEVEGGRSELEAIAEAHRPYYLATTTERAETNPKTGEKRITSRLVLRLNDSNGVAAALKDHGLLRANVRVVSSDAPKARRKGARSEFAKSMPVILKLRRDLRAELQELDTRQGDLRERGDVASEKRCREERERITRQLEHLSSGL